MSSSVAWVTVALTPYKVVEYIYLDQSLQQPHEVEITALVISVVEM